MAQVIGLLAAPTTLIAQLNGAQIAGINDNTDGFTLRITGQTARRRAA